MGKVRKPQADNPQRHERSERADHPPPEEDFGGGDFCSPETSPSTDDDKPLE